MYKWNNVCVRRYSHKLQKQQQLWCDVCLRFSMCFFAFPFFFPFLQFLFFHVFTAELEYDFFVMMNERCHLSNCTFSFYIDIENVITLGIQLRIRKWKQNDKSNAVRISYKCKSEIYILKERWSSNMHVRSQ